MMGQEVNVIEALCFYSCEKMGYFRKMYIFITVYSAGRDPVLR